MFIMGTNEQDCSTQRSVSNFSPPVHYFYILLIESWNYLGYKRPPQSRLTIAYHTYQNDALNLYNVFHPTASKNIILTAE